MAGKTENSNNNGRNRHFKPICRDRRRYSKSADMDNSIDTDYRGWSNNLSCDKGQEDIQVSSDDIQREGEWGNPGKRDKGGFPYKKGRNRLFRNKSRKIQKKGIHNSTNIVRDNRK